MLAPIALFVYNRPWHTRQTVDALLKNPLASESDLIVFSDAPRTPAQVEAVNQVREYIREISGFKSISIVERDSNFGLARSIIDGVSSILDRSGRIIVLEDDLITSPHFLKYMNDALQQYQSDDRVISVHGYIYPVADDLPETFFLRGADCWGWATWKRGWDLFEPDAKKLYDALQAGGEAKTFDFEGSYGYTKMLQQQIARKVNSWAIRWYASAFLANKLTLYPGASLVQNIGNDSSGTHCGNTDLFTGTLAENPVRVGGIPIVQSERAYKVVSRYFNSLKISFVSRVRNKLKSLFKRWITS